MTATVRSVDRLLPSVPTIEGAGVHLNRAFGNAEAPSLDPFLLLDHFESREPADYVAGFPWHPHRGIETVTYMIEGRVEHGDSLGNEGAIDSGDVQWMTSGSGILHQEMPQRRDGLLKGFQLWVNLPKHSKMERPAYRGLKANDIPTVKSESGATVHVVAGHHGEVEGPVRGLEVDPTYLDVELPAGSTLEQPTPKGYTALAYVVDGDVSFGAGSPPIPRRTAAILSDGESVKVTAGATPSRLLLVSGRPIREPVAWYGPIVMNTRDELAEAIVELRRGDFVKYRGAPDET